MKNKLRFWLLSVILIVTLCAFGGFDVYAANDDPGAGRLSGENIPDDFYDNSVSAYGQSAESAADYMVLRGAAGSDEVNPYTGLMYTHQSRFAKRKMVNCIDVSQWQGEIDWKRVKAAGIDYAFIRVGYRGYGEAGTLGPSTKDTYFETNMKNASAAGIKLGVYIFSQAITVKEAEEEAQYILDNVRKYKISLPLVMDYEYASGSPTGGRLFNANLSKKAATAICKAFCKKISKAGYTPMVYANKYMLENQLNASDITDAGYRVWLAHYTTDTDYAGEFDFWQYSSTGSVDGINGSVDMDYYYSKSTDNFLKAAVKQISITKAEVSKVKNAVYTGSKIKPAVSLSYKGSKLKNKTDYTIQYKDNKKPGKATITITGMGEYKGTQTISFIIKPGKPSRVTASDKADTYMTINWECDENATGYQIYRADSVDGTYKRIKTITDNKITSYKNKSLEPGKYYYYKIRSYVLVDGRKYYSEFSDVSGLYTKIGYKRTAIVKKTSRIYSKPNTASKLICRVDKDTILTAGVSRQDSVGNIWYKVKYKDSDNKTYSGYILGKRVNIAQKGTIKSKGKVNVYASYSTSSKRITRISNKAVVNILKTKEKGKTTWYKVAVVKGSKLYTGWISSSQTRIKY